MALVEATRPYMEFRTAGFLDWDPNTKAMLIATRFGNVAQLHTVAGPDMARRQISFEAEPLGGLYMPNDGTLVVRKDVGGSEFWQLFTLKNGQLTLLTDGKSRNEINAVSADGKLLAAGAYDATVRLWDSGGEDLKPLPSLTGHSGWVDALAFHPAKPRLCR